MATATSYASTPETTNANRAGRILLGPCTDQLRDVLRQRVPPANFHYVITRNRSNLPRLTQPQRDLILPRSGQYSGDYSDMDVSLLYLLLRNVCIIPPHNNGWGNLPDMQDSSLSASIDRIRGNRNRIVHSSTSLLSQTDFNEVLSDVKMAVISMDSYLGNSNRYEKAVDFLLTETMDPEQEVFIEQLRKQVEEDEITKDRLTTVEKLIQDHQERMQRLHTKHNDSQRQQSSMTENVQSHSIEISNITKDVHHIEKRQDQHEYIQCTLTEKVRTQRENITSLDAEIQNLQTGLQRNIRDIEDIKQRNGQHLNVTNLEPDVYRLKERLIEINNNETREIPLSPVQSESVKLPVEQLFASVVIKEDAKERGSETSKDCEQQEVKIVKTPEDLLTKNGKSVPRVFMLGKAAHGKTAYCMWLLKTWSNTQQTSMAFRPLTEWENALCEFDFVFHLPLRHVDTSRANVTDMICQDILGADTGLHTAAKHVLSSSEYRCLVIMDGLDEWKPNQSVIDRLKYKGMPNIDNMSNCLIFTTMRPWKFSEVAQIVRSDDRVIEIQGLDDKGIDDVIQKVLTRYYKMKPGSAKYNAMLRDMMGKMKNKTVNSFIKIPLLAVVCVQVWCEGEQVGDSMTSFYIAMVNMLIQRAHLKGKTQNMVFDGSNVSLPQILKAKKNIKIYSKVIYKLGKLAFDNLVSKEMKLVFQKDDLEREIGEIELQFALDVGLISQRNAHSIMEERVSVNFFHKSIQEFLAAIYIVTQECAFDLFYAYLCDVKVIMESSNVIMFISGMCPSLCSVISKHVVSVTDSDAQICEYRELPGQNNVIVRELYQQQASWYMESRYAQADKPIVFHVSDVYLTKGSWNEVIQSFRGKNKVVLEGNSDIETVRATREILFDHRVNIRSLKFVRVPTDRGQGITNKELNDFLSNTHRTRSLVMVFINGGNTDRSVDTICGPSLKALRLEFVQIKGNVHLSVLSRCDRLQTLYLDDVTLGDRDLGLIPRMSLLQEVTLEEVNMSAVGWSKWLQSIIDIHHQFDVRLVSTNIDRYSRSIIHSSHHLSITYHDRYVIEFTRTWPMTERRTGRCVLC